jgi:long-chain acyl-CoA synthetase
VRKPAVLARLAELTALPEGSPVDAPTRERGPRPIPAAGAASTLDSVTAVVADLAGLPAREVSADARLSSDLNLDSLQRVELLGIIEEELGTYIDDAALDPDATVASVAAMVDAAGATRPQGIHGWPLSPLPRLVGLATQTLVIAPLVRLLYRVRVSGLEHLDGLEGPVLFTPNHCLHTDNAIILTTLPLKWRRRLSIAAAADDIYGNRLQGFAASVIANAFPLAREGAVRRSLELLGARLDRGFSVLIFPEGKLTVGGPLQPFKAGAGLIAVESGTPVVPVRIHIRRISRVDARGGSLRGDVELVFGAALRFDSDADPAAATTRLEAAVAAL